MVREIQTLECSAAEMPTTLLSCGDTQVPAWRSTPAEPMAVYLRCFCWRRGPRAIRPSPLGSRPSWQQRFLRRTARRPAGDETPVDPARRSRPLAISSDTAHDETLMRLAIVAHASHSEWV